MRRLLLFVSIMFLLVGCKSQSVLTDESLTDKSVTQNAVSSGGSSEKKIIDQSIISQTENITFSGIVYDTSRPADSITGKPPVLFEGTFTNHTHQQVNNDITATDDSTFFFNDSTSTTNDIVSSSHSDVREKSHLPTISYILWAVFFIFLLIVLVFLFRK